MYGGQRFQFLLSNCVQKVGPNNDETNGWNLSWGKKEGKSLGERWNLPSPKRKTANNKSKSTRNPWRNIDTETSGISVKAGWGVTGLKLAYAKKNLSWKWKNIGNLSQPQEHSWNFMIMKEIWSRKSLSPSIKTKHKPVSWAETTYMYCENATKTLFHRWKFNQNLFHH